MKVIFLDFDGVLNSDSYIRSSDHDGLLLDPKCLILLKELVDATSAKIVLTTSWREHWWADADDCDDIGLEINRIFSLYDLRVYGKTPNLSGDREGEIKAWLDGHREVSGFVVLDDRFLDSPTIRGHFLKTDYYRYGLNEEGKAKALQILMG